MSLNHVSDQDIVECLQNCPELDGPLFDVTVLDELCFSDELWANLDISQAPPTLAENYGSIDYGRTGHELADEVISAESTGRGLEVSQKVYEEVPGMLTPPYSPPTPCSSTSSSVGSPPSVTPPTALPPISTQEPIMATTSTIPHHCIAASSLQQLFTAPQTNLPLTALHKAPTGPPQMPKPSLSTTVTQKTHVVQNLPTSCSQITLPHFNGSLQVLKSGETVQQLLRYSIPAHSNTPHAQPSASKCIKQEQAEVVGQKRQHPDTTSGQVDMSNLSKKQQRMIKNRESACVSRQKKRQYIDSLEARLKEAAFKNSALLQENTSLRKQVTVLEKENECMRSTLSRPSSPASGFPSPLKRPALVMMMVLCFSLSALYWNRGFLQDSHISLSPTTALTHVKSRALLSIEGESALSEYNSKPSFQGSAKRDLQASSRALVPVGSESTDLTSELEERIKRWKMRVGENRELPTQQIPIQSLCSCPVGNKTTNSTNIEMINEDMTSCFKLNSLLNSDEAPPSRKNSLTVLNQVYPTQLPNYFVDGPSRLYQDFKKFVPRDLDNYYLLSVKENVLLHPPRHNSSHYPLLSVFIPADSGIIVEACVCHRYVWTYFMDS